MGLDSDGLIFSQPTLASELPTSDGFDNSLLLTIPTEEGGRAVEDIGNFGQSNSQSPIINRLDTSSSPVIRKDLAVPPIKDDDLQPLLVLLENGIFGKPQDKTVDASDSVKRNPFEKNKTPVLKQFFSSIQNGQVKTPEGFQAGGPITMIVEGKEAELNSQTSMTLTSSDSGETIRVSGRLREDVGAGIFENRRVGQFTLPHSLLPGFYEINLTIDSQSTKSVLIQISDSGSLNRRRELVKIIKNVLNTSYEFPYALVGTYSPLPLGARIQDPSTGNLVTVVEQNNTWLFFAYDPTAFFGQPDARWILINGNTEEIEIIENREFGPEVFLSNDNPYPMQYDNRDYYFQQVFTTGDGLNFQNDDSERKEQDKILYQLTSTHEGQTVIGVPFKEGCDPKKVKKYAIFANFDDTQERFTSLLREEKNLIQKLGFDGTVELFPKDFLPHREKAFKKKVVSLDALKKAITNILEKEKNNQCCLEMVFFINAHQSSQNSVKITHKTKTKPIKTAVNNGKLVETISQVFKDAGRTCIPTAIIFHSCNSGKFDANGFSVAKKGSPNLRIYASSSRKQKTYGNKNGNEYFFIEGLKILLLPSDPLKTIEGNWDEIVDTTKETWLNYFAEECFASEMVKKFGKNWKVTYTNEWNEKTLKLKEIEIKKACKKRWAKKAQTPRRTAGKE